MAQNKKRRGEAGNIFLFILLGIVLFAAISFVMSRGFRSEGTSKVSARQAELIASEIIAHGQAIKRTVERLQRKGCSENEISFYSDKMDIEAFFKNNYNHGTAPIDKSCHVFDPNGGGLTYVNEYPEADRITQYTGSATKLYKSYMYIRRGQGVDVGDINKAELSMIIDYVNKDVCEAYNKIITGNPTPVSGAWGSQNDLVNGTFTDINDTAARTTGMKDTGALCIVKASNVYTIIYVVVAR